MEDKLLFQFSRAGHRLKLYIQKQMKSQGIELSPGQAGILFLLNRQDAMKMSEMSGVLEIDNSAITRLVDKLEAAGFVERGMNPQDRRQYLISITEAGRKEMQKMKAVANQTNEIIRQGFSDTEIESFVRVMKSFHEKFK